MNYLDDLETEILRKLERLSEGSTLNLDPNRVHQSRSGSTPPKGVDGRGQESHLSPDASLWAYHQQRLLNCREKADYVRLTAIAEAGRDYETSIKRPPAYISPDSEQNSKDRDDAILRHEGRRPEEAAVFERCSASYVRKIRKKHNRDMVWGGNLEGFA